jgi:hypothetical protein
MYPLDVGGSEGEVMPTFWQASSACRNIALSKTQWQRRGGLGPLEISSPHAEYSSRQPSSVRVKRFG